MGSIARFLAHAGVAWCSVSTLAFAEGPQALSEPSRAECLADHEQAQDARLAGQLLSARAALRKCSAAGCPSLVSRDCVQWLGDVEQQLPSVIFRAAKDGEDVVQLRVREGDKLLTESLTGSPLELDPGPHHFVAELPGFPAQDATYVLQAGDKGRVVRFDFSSPKPLPPALAPEPPVVAASPLPTHRPIPKLTYAFGGVSLAATVTGVVLGGLALSKRQDVREACAPLCQDRDVSSVKHLALGADIAFAVAILGGGATVYSYVTRPSVPLAGAVAPPAARFQLVWSGLSVTAGGSF
jgi:hypothetical protein